MKVVWSEPAIEDLQAIRDYIARDSEHYASRFVTRLLETVDLLQNSPELGQMVLELEHDDIRQIVYLNYRILYRREAQRVLILAIIHASRDFSRVDQERFGET